MLHKLYVDTVFQLNDHSSILCLHSPMLPLNSINKKRVQNVRILFEKLVHLLLWG